MNTVREDREALQAVLSELVPRLNWYARWPNTIEMPAGLIKPSIRREETQAGGIARRYTIEILTIASDNDDAQLEIDEYIDEDGDYSIKQAIEADQTLGDRVPMCIFIGWYDYGGRRSETVVYIGVSIDVEIWH